MILESAASSRGKEALHGGGTVAAGSRRDDSSVVKGRRLCPVGDAAGAALTESGASVGTGAGSAGQRGAVRPWAAHAPSKVSPLPGRGRL